MEGAKVVKEPNGMCGEVRSHLVSGDSTAPPFYMGYRLSFEPPVVVTKVTQEYQLCNVQGGCAKRGGTVSLRGWVQAPGERTRTTRAWSENRIRLWGRRMSFTSEAGGSGEGRGQ